LKHSKGVIFREETTGTTVSVRKEKGGGHIETREQRGYFRWEVKKETEKREKKVTVQKFGGKMEAMLFLQKNERERGRQR